MTTSVRTSSNYADEGGGEDDMTAFDIKPLQIPVEGTAVDESVKIPRTDDKEQEFDYLVVWGPRFEMLANMYGQKNE
uniref:Cadherin Y-type LIR-motif domain-containing protein n=1 Tax=Timema poppense TaxID=170557 RepID=A0A7R9CPN1_TIMPO|nr:unnamed protein product [Timema poppensis]